VLLTWREWVYLILAYCALASMTPMWLLMQPRGYLGGFVLFTALTAGLAGVLFGGYEIQQPAFKGFTVAKPLGTLFPFLFVTIACGACSGFHGLVCSGTTSKQVARESHTRFVGYGAMLAEALLAFLALATLMIARDADIAELSPGVIYGNGLGSFLNFLTTSLFGFDDLTFAATFGAMAFSTFVFDTLDVCTRLGRYLAQELFGWQGRAGAAAGTLLTIATPAWILMSAEQGSYMQFWTLFGASNQMLAALTLFAVGVWLRRAGRPSAFALVPMVFVLVMTTWAIGGIVLYNMSLAAESSAALANALAGTALLALAVFLVLTGWRRLRSAP
jgi:carbon starvation protein